MCEICGMSICPSRCPNSDEPPVYARCDNCGGEIRDGEEYYQVGEHNYCEECVQYKTAEVEDYGYED